MVNTLRRPGSPFTPEPPEPLGVPMFSVASILVPFDFSETSQAALSLAMRLVQDYGAQLHMVTVERNLDREIKKRIVSEPHGNVVDRTIADNEQAMLDAVEQELDRATAAGQAWDYPEVTTHVAGGSWKTVVANLVEELEIDCMVVGTHGRQGLVETFMGTETEEWVRTAPCSVLVVKAQGYPYLRD
jgi:nucleotide-binding universal stress UspA family protein